MLVFFYIITYRLITYRLSAYRLIANISSFKEESQCIL